MVELYLHSPKYYDDNASLITHRDNFILQYSMGHKAGSNCREVSVPSVNYVYMTSKSLCVCVCVCVKDRKEVEDST
jgi:hypothetical protein